MKKQSRKGSRSMRGFKVRKTAGQLKKHVSQMTTEELQYLDNALANVKSVRKSFHLTTNKETGSIPESKFLEVLSSKVKYSIIEFNRTEKNGKVSRRVLVRSNEAEERVFHQSHDFLAYGKASLCFVIDIDDNTIVTAYYNCDSDMHFNIDMSRYTKELVII